MSWHGIDTNIVQHTQYCVNLSVSTEQNFLGVAIIISPIAQFRQFKQQGEWGAGHLHNHNNKVNLVQ
jgi:hypothetical protein